MGLKSEAKGYQGIREPGSRVTGHQEIRTSESEMINLISWSPDDHCLIT